MHLEVGSERLPVNQLGPDFAFVETTATHLPGPANLSVTVDDDLHRSTSVFPRRNPTRDSADAGLMLAKNLRARKSAASS